MNAQHSDKKCLRGKSLTTGSLSFDYELQVLVPTEEAEEADYVNYGINGTLDL